MFPALIPNPDSSILPQMSNTVPGFKLYNSTTKTAV